MNSGCNLELAYPNRKPIIICFVEYQQVNDDNFKIIGKKLSEELFGYKIVVVNPNK